VLAVEYQNMGNASKQINFNCLTSQQRIEDAQYTINNYFEIKENLRVTKIIKQRKFTIIHKQRVVIEFLTVDS